MADSVTGTDNHKKKVPGGKLIVMGVSQGTHKPTKPAPMVKDGTS